MLENKKKLKTFIIGDYQVGYGQGLIVNAGFSMNKTAETMKIMKTNNLGLKPYTSFSSTGFFRGMATTFLWKYLEITTYYSNLNLDGEVLKHPQSGKSYTRSIVKCGAHRTPQEINKKGNINEQVLGHAVVYKTPNNLLNFGMNTVYNRYSTPVYPKANQYNQFMFKGKENIVTGFFYNYLWQNCHLFGEAGVANSGGKGLVTGVLASLSVYFDAALLLRHYDKNFHSFYGHAFSENTTNTDETGVYWGIHVKPLKKLHVAAYYDWFKFPIPKYQVDAPSQGYDWRVKLTYQFSRRVLMYGQLRERGKKTNVKDNTKKKTQGRSVKKGKHVKLAPVPHTIALGKLRTYTTGLDYALGAFSFTSKAQWNTYDFVKKITRGYAFVQDIFYKIRKIGLGGRVAFFRTDDYKNRLYFYEKDILYSFNFPFYDGNGLRYYIIFRYKITQLIQLELKYAQTRYRGDKQIGSGLDKIEGKIKTDISLQALFKF